MGFKKAGTMRPQVCLPDFSDVVGWPSRRHRRTLTEYTHSGSLVLALCSRTSLQTNRCVLYWQWLCALLSHSVMPETML